MARFLNIIINLIRACFRSPSKHSAILLDAQIGVSASIQAEIHRRGTALVETTKAEQPPPPNIPVSPAFKLVFLSVLGITIACGITEIGLASIWEHPTPNQQAAFEAIGFAWKAGLGAIFGLLGGKVT